MSGTVVKNSVGNSVVPWRAVDADFTIDSHPEGFFYNQEYYDEGVPRRHLNNVVRQNPALTLPLCILEQFSFGLRGIIRH